MTPERRRHLLSMSGEIGTQILSKEDAANADAQSKKTETPAPAVRTTVQPHVRTGVEVVCFDDNTPFGPSEMQGMMRAAERQLAEQRRKSAEGTPERKMELLKFSVAGLPKEQQETALNGAERRFQREWLRSHYGPKADAHTAQNAGVVVHFDERSIGALFPSAR